VGEVEMLQRLIQMLRKEFKQLFRDKRARMVLFVPPLVQMMVFGYAATFELRNVRLAVLDLDNTSESRELIARFTASRYFQVRARLEAPRQIREAIDSGVATIAIHIRAGFAQELRKGSGATVQVVTDGTDSNTALIAQGYISQIAGEFARDYQLDRIARTSPLLVEQLPRAELERRPWYNADLRSRWFFVPGVIGSIILIMVTVLTAFAVVREREIGTLEQVMVTPIRPLEFILGKTVPFFLIGLADAALIASVGTFWFEIPFRGNPLVLLLGVVLYILSMLGLGLFISTVSATQQQAMVTAFFFIMPFITFSGFAFPISSMPEVMQWMTYANPLRYFLVVIRGVYLKGVGLDVLWPQMAALALLATFLLTLAVLRFHKSLD
jgi:ABC-2 type transport system permease protein